MQLCCKYLANLKKKEGYDLPLQSMTMKKKLIIFIVFFLFLVSGFLFALTRLIPGFGDVRLPVLSYVQPFSFTSQEGHKITEKDVQGKVYVAEYFFTTCKGVCPKMNTNLKKVYESFKNEKDFMILSHTVDPEIDTVARMKRYSDSLGLTKGNWLFLTGRKDSLYNAARVSYLLDDPENNSATIENQFLHTQFFALIDKAGRVRKVYDGLKKDELNELSSDIKDLLNENPLASTATQTVEDK
jgi:protein SCO1/2